MKKEEVVWCMLFTSKQESDDPCAKATHCILMHSWGERLYHEKSTKSKRQNEKRATWGRLSDKKGSRLSCSRVSRGHGRQPKQWQFQDFFVQLKISIPIIFESFCSCKNKTRLLETLQCTSNAGSLSRLPKGLVYRYCTSFACLGLKILNWSQNKLYGFAGGQSCIF